MPRSHPETPEKPKKMSNKFFVSSPFSQLQKLTFLLSIR